jgi:ribonuclease VapC
VNSVVLDASAILALILGESFGASGKPPADLLPRTRVSAVNLVEIRTKLIDLARPDLIDLTKLLSLGMTIEPFTASQALIASDLRLSTKHLGLSLGDRACLALALEAGLEVYTCDQAWSKLTIGCQIHQLR